MSLDVIDLVLISSTLPSNGDNELRRKTHFTLLILLLSNEEA